MPEFPYRSRHRMSGARAYQAAFAARCAKSRPPVTVFLRPNGGPEHRLGLSIGKRVGNAVIRVRVKRIIRDAFRLDRTVYPTPPTGGHYDIVVSARAHKSISLDEMRDRLREAIAAAHRQSIRQNPPMDRSVE